MTFITVDRRYRPGQAIQSALGAVDLGVPGLPAGARAAIQQDALSPAQQAAQIAARERAGVQTVAASGNTLAPAPATDPSMKWKHILILAGGILTGALLLHLFMNRKG